MGRESAATGLSNALREQLAKTPGVEMHGPSLRIWFMWRGKRCRESLGLQPTKANIKHAAQKRAAVLHAIKTGAFEYGAYFPESKNARASDRVREARLGEVADRYMQLKSTDLTPETQQRYGWALASMCESIGNDLLVSTLMPEDIQLLRGEFAATRAVGTANGHLAVLSGLLKWCKANGYTTQDLSSACGRIAAEDVDPDPFTHLEFRQLIEQGCLHPQDVAAVTLACYTGLRPGEMGGLAREDGDLERQCLTVRRAVTDNNTLKVPKTKRERTVWLLPPAAEAFRQLFDMTAHLEPEDTTVWLNRHQSRVDTVTPLVSPTIQARQRNINRWMKPDSWYTKMTALMARAKVRHRRPYQTRHTYACWSLTAHGNLAFIANQLGHKDYSMLVKVYARWMDTESSDEAARIWSEMQERGAFCPTDAPENSSEPAQAR